jgi:hypothetical protein
MAGDVSGYKTYTVARPEATHWRPATCAEVECGAWANGWATTVPSASPQAQYIRAKSGRAFTERAEGTSVVFLFKPGQRCFASDGHRLPVEREPLFIVRDGDYRGNPSGWRMRHSSGQAWVDDFGEHQQRLKETQERG